MGVVDVFTFLFNGQPGPRIAKELACEAVRSLHPLSERRWERSARFWSQEKTGHDDVNVLHRIKGVLSSVVSIDIGDKVVLLQGKRDQQASQQLLEGDAGMLSLLKSLQYNELKEVSYNGTAFSFGDLVVVAGNMMKRTNDVQFVGCFLSVEYKGSCMAKRAAPIITAFCKELFEQVQLLQKTKTRAPAGDFVLVSPPELAAMGPYFSSAHEAICYLAAIRP